MIGHLNYIRNWIIPSYSHKIEMEEKRPTHCERGELMGGFGIFIQTILGLIAFSTLMLKRLREPKKHRRRWIIWFFDTSKQGFGTLFIHFANVFLADALSAEDPCTWYLISFLLDSTVGLLLIYFGLKLAKYIVSAFDCTSLYFGEYGDPPKCNAWLGQCAIYLVIMIVEKVLVGLMVMPQFWQEVRKYMFSWLHDPRVEVILVMLIIPFVVNTIMFWVIDNFLMRKTKRFYGSGSTISDTYKQVKLGSKTQKNCKVSYKIAARSDSFDSGDDLDMKGVKSSPKSSTVRYHKIHASNHDSKLKAKNTEETLLLLQDEAEIPRGPSINDVLSSEKLVYSNPVSDVSDDNTNTDRLLTSGVKRL